MDTPLNEFLKYYNGYIKTKGFEPTAYDVNYWVQNFFKQTTSKEKKVETKNNSEKK